MNCVPVQPLHIVLLIQPSIRQSTAKVNVPTSLVVPLIAPDAVLKVMIKRGSKHSFACCPFAVMPLRHALLSVRGNSESL